MILLTVLINSSFAQSTNPLYQKSLADSLGADDYGMKSYVFAILKTGPNKNKDKKYRDSIFMGHLQNIKSLASEGKLALAGPMGENSKKIEGIFIFNVKTVAEAKELIKTDPAISNKFIDAELYPWYGSAALPMFLKYHDIVKKKDF
jgi:uncharacterized protein YciI